ncbi:hypothetical protein GWO60_04510 [Corynebacterium macginleyi]|uniref:Transposase n=1 Tax=Corynebacterium macginleyi TaxID=38290 RepID=A0ABS1Y3U5_9CORY|nr:hypothetical protein [Corynebacterium macginleyi]MBK4173835.1 hypothetical protein [Corynebacterium macginleyi]MBM0242956.1 hypothetical protein [Corynebacterium macginleyi]
MSYIPLKGSKVIEKANGELERRQTPATVLRKALTGVSEDAPDGSNGTTKSEPVRKAVDPSQGRGYPGKAQRPDRLLDALLKTVY